MSILKKRSYEMSDKTIWWHGPDHPAADSYTLDDTRIEPLLSTPGSSVYFPEGHFYGSFPGTNKVMPLARAVVSSVAGSVVTVPAEQGAAFLVGYEIFLVAPSQDDSLFNSQGVYDHASAYYGASQGLITSVVTTGAVTNITLGGPVTAVAGSIVTSKQYVRGIAERSVYLGSGLGLVENCAIALYEDGWLNRDYIPYWDRQLSRQFPDLMVNQQYAIDTPLT
jgi:hypothetical protein